jgi:alpha-tubulin suppressor-like RCC1 family protein
MDPRKSISVVSYFIIIFISVFCSAEPVYIPVLKVSGGEAHSLFLTEANSVFATGWNYE